MTDALDDFYNIAHQLADKLECVIQGKTDFIQLLTLSFLVRGHVLIEDLPGVGKTTAVKTLAKLIQQANYGRIQCTPDLLPYDVTGVEIFQSHSGEFCFTPGPIFHDIVLVDEINRATPKTQSALLEAMAERQVTVSGKTYPLPDLFWVAATQNPLEYSSTYPLPSAELDRFLVKLTPGYVDFETECQIASQPPCQNVLPTMTSVVEKQKILSIQKTTQLVYCDMRHARFAVRIAQQTRQHPDIAMGVSPRGPLGLLELAKAHAIFAHRDFVTDEDIVPLVLPVYQHRIICKEAQFDIPAFLQDATKMAALEFF